ncbi:MAG: two pore domain potassium channel family protein [Myxococcales bacterium]|nr:MAG: two pore domain potassium channel family protein [Myxococcales bacterium]
MLLIAQLTAVLLYPFLAGNRVGLAALAVISMVIVSAALWAVRNTEVLWYVAILLGVPAMMLSVAEALWPDSGGVELASAAFHVPFYFYVSYALISYLFDDNFVTTDELWAAAAAFTVVAWGFGYAYVAIQVIWPGAFVGTTEGPFPFFALLFLSFTNLTSVGLSDLLPVDGHARSIVMIQQVVGVMYVGLVVARIVGLTIQRARRP